VKVRCYRYDKGEFVIELPDDILCSGSTLEDLVEEIFPNLGNDNADLSYMTRRVILTPKNSDVDRINEIVSGKLSGSAVVYSSADSIEDEEQSHLFPVEFLNSLTPNGLPSHKLSLKVGVPIILLRNLNQKEGLCNGTRLIVRALQPHVIDAEICVGKLSGKRVFIPRIASQPCSLMGNCM
jgi:ATP-dependent DNA helicase PIF1